MTEFINMWKNFANFKDRTTVRGYWMAYLINIIISFVLGIIVGITGFTAISIIYVVALIIPSLSMMIRRLRDMGRRWTSIFIGLIPCVGIILLIVFLVKPSVPDDGVPVV